MYNPYNYTASIIFLATLSHTKTKDFTTYEKALEWTAKHRPSNIEAHNEENRRTWERTDVSEHNTEFGKFYKEIWQCQQTQAQRIIIINPFNRP